MTTTKLYGGKVIINFDENLHRFSDTKGNKILGVTSITGLLDKSRPLMFWAVGQMRDFLLDVLDKGKQIGTDHIQEASKQHQLKKEKAADVGQQIHDWIEKYIKAKKSEMPEDEQVRSGIIAFLSFVNSEKLKFLSAERIIYSKKHNYAGIEDWEAIDKDDKNCLVIGDNKSSNGIYNEMRYQLALYWNAREEETKKKFKKGIICRFDKNTGEFEKLIITHEEYEKDLGAALGLLATKRREVELCRR